MNSRYDEEGKCLGLLPSLARASASLSQGEGNMVWCRPQHQTQQEKDECRLVSLCMRHRSDRHPLSYTSPRSHSSHQTCKYPKGERLRWGSRPTNRGQGGLSSSCPRSFSGTVATGEDFTGRGWRSESRSRTGGRSGVSENSWGKQDRFGVCKDSRLGPVLTMALNQKGNLLATIHSARQLTLIHVQGRVPHSRHCSGGAAGRDNHALSAYIPAQLNQDRCNKLR